jgi:hypothetical protein
VFAAWKINTLRAFLYNNIPMIPTMRDPKAMRIDTTLIGTEDLSKASAVFDVGVGVGVDDEVEASVDDKADAERRRGVEGWASCGMYVIG